MKSFVELAKEKAENAFLKEQKNYPDLYSDVLKPLFISAYVDGYLEGYSDSNTVSINRLENLNAGLVENIKNEEI